MGGLAAIERYRLDKVLYVVAGQDKRKPHLADQKSRHRIAREVLGFFSPLLEYSPIAYDGAADGEENVFRVIAACGAGPVHAFYIAGSDHCRRFGPNGGPGHDSEAGGRSQSAVLRLRPPPSQALGDLPRAGRTGGAGEDFSGRPLDQAHASPDLINEDS
jgi:hypothetical protein